MCCFSSQILIKMEKAIEVLKKELKNLEYLYSISNKIAEYEK